MGIGDLVCWRRIADKNDYYDVGIVIGMESNESPYALYNIMSEVYFMRIGHLWCAPDYLEVVSPYKG